MAARRDAESSDDLPAIIPEVVFDRHGEPIIAKQIVVKPSPVPRTLAVLMMLLGALSVGLVMLGQDQRDDDTKAFNAKILAVQNAQAKAQDELSREVARNRKLVLDLLSAPTPEKRRQLLEDFSKQTAVEQAGASPSPVPRSSPTPGRVLPPSSRPRPDPAPSSSKSPSPSPSPSCLVKVGDLCVPPGRSQ